MRRVDTGNVGGFGDGFQKGTVIQGTDVDVTVGPDVEFSRVDKTRHDGADTGDVEDIFDEKLETAFHLVFVTTAFG